MEKYINRQINTKTKYLQKQSKTYMLIYITLKKMLFVVLLKAYEFMY